MDIDKVRARFRYYRQQIQELNEAIDDTHYWAEESSSRAIHRAEACRREAAERERQAESDRWYREEELRSATEALERAQSYGDEYGIANAMRKLKNLS